MKIPRHQIMIELEELVEAPGPWDSSFIYSLGQVLGRWRRFGYPIVPEKLLKPETEEEKLVTDRFVYGSSFELNGKRVDPTRVVLNSDGTYQILDP